MKMLNINNYLYLNLLVADGGSSFSLSTAYWILIALALYLFIALLVLLVVCLCIKRGRCIKKGNSVLRPPTPDIEIKKGEICSRKAFSMPSEMVRAIDVNLVFKPKIPLHQEHVISILESHRRVSTLPFLMPKPKVDPIYLRPVDLYLRSNSGISMLGNTVELVRHQ